MLLDVFYPLNHQFLTQYNGACITFTKYTWGTGTNCAYREQTVVSAAGRGAARPVWDMLRRARRRATLTVTPRARAYGSGRACRPRRAWPGW